MARRLVERGVRHTLLVHGVQIGSHSWDDHSDVKGGATAGQTDEFSLRSVGAPIHMRDVHATLLRLMGLDDDRLTYLYGGRLRRLTDIGGQVLSEIIA